MKCNELLNWQWQGYHQYHCSKVNLAIHLVAVPMFICASVSLIFGLFLMNLPISLGAIGALLLSIILQAIGHRKERLPPEKFTGVSNFVLRLCFEQFITFPKFIWVSSLNHLNRNVDKNNRL
ncbi:terminase [Vibrio amylolyticus]|uniref:terminase n=1 Tax=Vibrio amylolyticus TaxID=2847292 RepID=UPI00354F7737